MAKKAAEAAKNNDPDDQDKENHKGGGTAIEQTSVAQVTESSPKPNQGTLLLDGLARQQTCISLRSLVAE